MHIAQAIKPKLLRCLLSAERHYIESSLNGEKKMTLEEVFSPNGALDNVLNSYSFRSNQLEMSELIDKGFNENKNVVIEAGTGIGKSFAYLVPAFLLLDKDKSKKVVVATSTTTLQKQLYEKDIPLVTKALGISLNTAILYGRSNYLCLRKYTDIYESRKLLSLDPESSEALFDSWVQKTDTGAIQDAPKKVAFLFKELRSDSHECLGRSCPFHEECFFFQARRKAQKANLVVTNHHIVLYDARIRAENEEGFDTECILPGYTHLVMDEAHHIQDEATSILSDEFSTELAEFILDELTRKRKKKKESDEEGVKEEVDKLSLLDAVRRFEKVDPPVKQATITNSISHIRLLLDSFDSELKAILSGHFDRYQILFTREFYNRFRERIRAQEALAEELHTLSNALDNLYSEDAKDPILDIVKRYSSELMCLSNTLRSWIRFSDFDSFIPYAEEDRRSGKYTIKIAPMCTGPILYRTLVRNMESMLYCSATLCVNNSFAFFSNDSGFKEDPDHLEGIFLSPFDYGHSLMLLVPEDGMEFITSKKDEYNRYASYVTAKALQSSAGGALVLFTAKDMLNEVCQNVKKNLGPDYRILSQTDTGIHKARLLEEFKNDEDASLFATDSFWEGVDAPGNTLRLVIIEKLPFKVPTDPIEMARSNYINSKSGNESASFMQITVPNACIKLKQGIGRLIRSEDDRGVVLILDKRIISKGYRAMMLNTIPQGYRPEDTLLDNIENKIERFLFQ